jgi:hypothetical protein
VTALKNLGVRLLAWGRRFTFEVGIDLRGSPPVRTGFPPSLLLLGVLLVGIAGLAVASGLYLPRGLRPFVVPICYTAWLAGLVGLWALLVAAILLAFFVPMALIHDAFVGTGTRRRAQSGVVAGYFLSLAVAGVLLPVWGLLALCGVALLVNLLTVCVPANGAVRFLWRPRDGGAVRAVPWSVWVTAEFTLLTLAAGALILLACGGRVFGSADEWATVPVTTFLGSVLAWLAPGVLGALVTQTVLGRWRDPARPARPLLHVASAATAADRSRLRRLLTPRGWDVRFGKDAPAEAVRVALVRPELSQATEFEPTWPLAVSLADLDDELVRDRLVRRDEIQKRRKAFTALEGLFKRAAGRDFQAGQGFWVAPHFWFIAGVNRDTPEDDVDFSDGTILSGTIGPPYHRVMSRATRHHLYRVLRAAQVDLIFVEDGVKFGKFKRVMRVMFDLYDRHRGERRAEDIHFVGLKGTRVLIHDFSLEEPFKSETYPEPKYEHLARARILHIFKDRGEHEEPLETPFDFSSTPAPMALV